jgi:hypothetical protein
MLDAGQGHAGSTDKQARTVSRIAIGTAYQHLVRSNAAESGSDNTPLAFLSRVLPLDKFQNMGKNIIR